MTKKYKIMDHSANYEKNYIDENAKNCTEESAAVFDSEKEASAWLEFQAERGVKFFDSYEFWASIVECWA